MANANNNNNQNNDSSNNGNQSNGQQAAGWKSKAACLGTGAVVGFLLYPVIRKGLEKLQPQLNGLLDGFAGQAESLIEKGSDLMAAAKERARGADVVTPFSSVEKPEPVRHTHTELTQ